VAGFLLRQLVGTSRALKLFTMTSHVVDQSLSNELFGPESGVTTVHGADSWTSLVATTMGLDALGRLRIIVRSKFVGLERGRLVVQAFAKAGSEARPLASAQRAVSREDLLSGVEITLHPNDGVVSGHHVLAWIEPGEPDLEYDGLRAKPRAPISLGRVRALRNKVEVDLQPFAA
jgi:hypothetical protein